MLIKMEEVFYWSRVAGEMDMAFNGAFTIQVNGVATPVLGYGRTDEIKSFIHLYENHGGKLLFKMGDDLEKIMGDGDLPHLNSLYMHSDDNAYLIIPQISNDGKEIHYHSLQYSDRTNSFQTQLLSKYSGLDYVRSPRAIKTVVRLCQSRMEDLNKIIQFAGLQAAPLSQKHTFEIKEGEIVCVTEPTGYNAVDLSKLKSNVNIPKQYILDNPTNTGVTQSAVPWDVSPTP